MINKKNMLFVPLIGLVVLSNNIHASEPQEGIKLPKVMQAYNELRETNDSLANAIRQAVSAKSDNQKIDDLLITKILPDVVRSLTHLRTMMRDTINTLYKNELEGEDSTVVLGLKDYYLIRKK